MNQRGKKSCKNEIIFNAFRSQERKKGEKDRICKRQNVKWKKGGKIERS